MMRTTKKMTFHTSAIIVRPQASKYSFAMSTHVCNVLTDFAKKSGFDCCFLSAQCIERQARTSGDVETRVFTPLNVN